MGDGGYHVTGAARRSDVVRTGPADSKARLTAVVPLCAASAAGYSALNPVLAFHPTLAVPTVIQDDLSQSVARVVAYSDHFPMGVPQMLG